MTALFISDLHLDGTRPETTRLLLDFLQRDASQASALYILGDFFEVWIGDDDDDAHHAQVMAALRALTGAGVPVYLMHGNRDFLIGKRFADRTGVKLLSDPTLIDLGGIPTLLMHGDTLCTDDRQYQKARRFLRNPLVQGVYLALPLSLRRRIADYARAKSKADTAAKASYIMDVNQGAVEETMRAHGVTRLIHGHTHRPAVHRFKDSSGNDMERIVLGDWHDQSSILKWSGNGGKLSDTRVSDGAVGQATVGTPL
ncbi:MAG TPA: UDP-2,3-diacylglucosamine diphosphatase [Gammaproteobacteria bacterium]|nr:UDP-2,3-diacylglucosamine diphosphatase [Gammaproteobacteria bacterium]